jgi:hypothetical protein
MHSRPLDTTTWPNFAALVERHNGAVAMFEQHGFERTRRLGKHHWVVTKVVA